MPKNLRSGLSLVRPVTALLVTVAVIGCAARPTSEDPGSLMVSRDQALVRAHEEWIDFINRGDTKRGLDGMTEDAAIIAPGGPIAHGSEQVRQSVERLSSVPGLHVEFTLTQASVSPDGRVGFVVGDSKITVPGPDGTLHATSQRLLTVWRKDDNRKWRCYLDVVMGAAGSPPR